MKYVLLVLAFALIGTFLRAQPESITWQRTIGGSGMDYIGGMDERLDGGYFICGYGNSIDGDFVGSQGGDDLFVASVSADGELENLMAFGSSGFDRANDLITLSDRGFSVVGRSGISDGDITTGNNGSADVWLGIFNADLELTDQYGFGGNDLDEGMALIETSDGGILLTGETSSSDGSFGEELGFSDVFLVKLDADYSLEWLKRMGGSASERAESLLETDGGYVVTGSSESSDNDLEVNQGEDDAWVFKVDTAGNLLWSTSFGGSFFDSFYGIEEDNDGNFVLVGTSKFEDEDVIGTNSRYGLIATVSSEGTLLEQLDVGTQSDEELFDVIVQDDGSKVCLGLTNGSFSLGGIGGSDYYLLEVDASNNVVWEQVYGGSSADGGYELLEDAGGFVLAGQHLGSDGDISASYGAFDVSILRIGSAGAVQGCTDPEACNYDEQATEDDGSCDYLDTFNISGNLMPDLESSELYTYPETAGSTYEWTVSSGTIIEGQGSAELGILWIAEGASQLCVTETREDGCAGEEVCENIVVLPTDIDELEGESIVVYPNPANMYVTVSVVGSWLAGVYEVIDLQGRVVLQGTASKDRIILDVSGLTSGRYEFVIRHDAKSVSCSLVIRK